MRYKYNEVATQLNNINPKQINKIDKILISGGSYFDRRKLYDKITNPLVQKYLEDKYKCIKGKPYYIKIENNHYYLVQLPKDDYRKKGFTWFYDDEVDDIILAVTKDEIDYCPKTKVVNRTIHEEILKVDKWKDIFGDYYLYFVKPKVIKL